MHHYIMSMNLSLDLHLYTSSGPFGPYARKMADSASISQRVVIVGAGAFGLTTALELCRRGYNNVVVLDRHVPPVCSIYSNTVMSTILIRALQVPDGSSVDISRIIRFDYGDPVYAKLAKEAYDIWNTSPLYSQAFHLTPFVLTAANSSRRAYVDKCTESLEKLGLPWQGLKDAADTRRQFPALSGPLAHPSFHGYVNHQAGWADAQQAIALLRDQCLHAGVSFISGRRGTVTELITDPQSRKIHGLRTMSGDTITGDQFVLAAGAWSSSLVPMYNTTLSTAQVLAFMKMDETEMKRYKELPICMNFSSGWFCFPPHPGTGYLKFVIHGLGYTRTEQGVSSLQNRLEPARDGQNLASVSGLLSTPPWEPRDSRTDFAPSDGLQRLRSGIQEALPELATRDFDLATVCWYTDTPTGDFIVDYHKDYANLFLATGGSGQ